VPDNRDSKRTVKLRYTYDALNRVVEERSNKGAVATIGYDTMGNIISKDGSAFATYDAGNKLNSLKGVPYTSDLAGNLLNVPTLGTTTPGVELTYDAKNKLVKAGGVSYGYDETGQLVWREEAGKRVYVIRLSLAVLGEITPEGIVETVYTLADESLVSSKTGPTTTVYHHGHLGQTLFTTTSATATPTAYDYTMYGERRDASAVTVPLMYGYVGKEWCRTDNTTKLILCGQRWYAPQVGRWVTRDPIGYEGGYNMYNYTSNNPIIKIDPYGENPLIAFCFVQPQVCSAMAVIVVKTAKEGADASSILWDTYIA
jgi:RHS repeat-associated protein